MLFMEFNDFDEMFIGVTRKFLTNPEIVERMSKDKGYLDDLVVTTSSCKCTIDIGKLGYAKNKWDHLVNSYVGKDELKGFLLSLQSISGLSYTFRFREKHKGNGSCLVALVLSRDETWGTWKRAKVFYRVAEVNRKMAADLVLISKILQLVPESDIKGVSFFMAQAYCDADFVNGYFDMFGVPREKMGSKCTWSKRGNDIYRRYYQEDSVDTKFRARKVLRDLLLGKKLPDVVDPKKLKLYGMVPE